MNQSIGTTKTLNDYVVNKKLTALKPAPKTQAVEQNWFIILINFVLGFTSELLEIAATAVLGPVTGMLIGIGLDIGFNILADTITGRDPWEANNVMFNIILPFTSMPGRIKGVSKIRKSKVLGLGDTLSDSNLQSLAKRLNSMDLSDIGAIEVAERQYNLILDEFNDFDLLNIIDPSRIEAFQKYQSKNAKDFGRFYKVMRTTNKTLSLLSNPDQAVQSLFRFATKDLKTKWNRGYTSYFKKIKSKLLKSSNKATSLQLIELHHTKAPWISGIRLKPIGHAIGWYHVFVFFNPVLTNNKQSVILYNKPIQNIVAFINAPSAGQYYINNISWGWEIGKMIRKNNSGGILAAFNSIAYSSHFSQTVYHFAKAFNSTMKLIEQFSNFEAYKNKWRAAVTTNVAKNMIAGSTDGIKGLGALNRVRKTLSGDGNRHIIRYTQKMIKRGTKYIIKAKQSKGR